MTCSAPALSLAMQEKRLSSGKTLTQVTLIEAQLHVEAAETCPHRPTSIAHFKLAYSGYAWHGSCACRPCDIGKQTQDYKIATFSV